MRDEEYYKRETVDNKSPKLSNLERFRYQRILGLIRGDSLLDVGSGNGFFLKMAVTRVSKQVGIDISPDRVKISKKYAPQAKIGLGSIYKTGFNNSQFDTVVCLEVVEHIASWKSAVKELQRITNNRLIISVPNNEVIKKEVCTHCGKLTPRNRHLNSFSIKKIEASIDKKKFKITSILIGNRLLLFMPKNLQLLYLLAFVDFILNILRPKSGRWLVVVADRVK